MTTKRIAVSERPNQSSASGSQQIDGSACNPVTTVPIDSRSERERASETERHAADERQEIADESAGAST